MTILGLALLGVLALPFLIPPVGVVTWASVSDEIDQRLMAANGQPFQLELKDWVGGQILWLIDAVGERTAVEALLKRLSETQLKGQTVKSMKRPVTHG